MSAKLLDSTLVSLCMEIYDWALYTYTKGAMKLHTLLNFATFLPKNVYIINGKGSDNTSAREVKGPPHCIGLADRGYCDFGLLHDWDSIEVFFRILKQNFHIKRFVGTTRNAMETQDTIGYGVIFKQIINPCGC